MAPKPVVLCILDGWGTRSDAAGERARIGQYAKL
jgi:bisphosphoglycerate-independent phosphoglycerate mutase (AlkP superfamily)